MSLVKSELHRAKDYVETLQQITFAGIYLADPVIRNEKSSSREVEFLNSVQSVEKLRKLVLFLH